jgi:hypothetical protein
MVSGGDTSNYSVSILPLQCNLQGIWFKFEFKIESSL